MKTLCTGITILCLLINSVWSFAQSVSIRAPKQGAVYQRNNNNMASVPIAGQLFGEDGEASSYTVDCYASRQDGNNNLISGAPVQQVTLSAPKGIFNGSISLSKGWYRIRLVFTRQTGSGPQQSDAYINAGVGDVFIIAGQSNAQGVTGSNISTPSPISTPELVRGLNIFYLCDRDFAPNSALYPLGSNLGPNSQTKWCYELLGKKISDANADSYSGMPVAFFNTALGGTSVTNWSDGANGNRAMHGYLSIGWCENYPIDGAFQSQAYYQGQPYLSFRNTLNWYVQQYGTRAVLWHQGEADADYRNTAAVFDANDYTTKLNNVIQKSRDHLGRNDLSWVISKASLSEWNTTGGTSTPDALASKTLTGQANTVNMFNQIYEGPFTDQNNGSSTAPNRGDLTHFSESASQGLTLLANLWNTKIDPSSSSITPLTRIDAAAVPNVSIDQSGSTYTLTASGGYDGYCWVQGYPDDIRDAPPSNGCYSNNQSISVAYASGWYRCYVRKGNNWQSTLALVPRISCTSCRQAAETASDEDITGIYMTVSPNPSFSDLKVAFNVPQDRTPIRLEIFDMHGKSVKVLTDAIHAKGHYVYPIINGLAESGTYIAQLMVGEIYQTRKIVRVK